MILGWIDNPLTKVLGCQCPSWNDHLVEDDDTNVSSQSLPRPRIQRSAPTSSWSLLDTLDPLIYMQRPPSLENRDLLSFTVNQIVQNSVDCQ
ncbi:hypothetical protein P692DRAFT_201087492 [Suillus brevipes Sb2]|nr:hypothetical protein P692DRAFT_201087492 [Suillus brevipes Sb2]